MSLPPSNPSSPWCPMVALRHERSDQPDHIDWLLARSPDGTEPLESFRLLVPPWELDADGRPLGMQAIADHRPAYLELDEGDVSGGRGRVQRLRRGRARRLDEERLEIEWEGAAAVLVRIVTNIEHPDPVAPPDAEFDGERICWLEPAGKSFDPDAA